MAYATLQNIIDYYGNDQLLITFDRDNNGVVDSEIVAAALDRASAEIDGYLTGRYTVPLVEPVPEILIGFCVDIALYKGAFNPALVTEEKRKRYRDAIRYLEKVAEGRITLGIEKPSQGGSGGASFVAAERITGRDRMKGIL